MKLREMQLITANIHIYSVIAWNNHNKAPYSQFSANSIDKNVPSEWVLVPDY